ncbi:GntR family transcriptional regulator [Cucumibacter marinus]|uniref:GntR family transcriptional regulator n=1 Tax=Cucumibacter marinus TaxID=1121252 RepID=UPI000416325C|nr:GntR family transcriptional regulator [Cucumibacter marinus]
MSEKFHAVSSPSLVGQVKEQIQRAITDGELLPNRRLGESEIAEKLGVSRGPVREAARLLEQRGLLVYLPRRGFFVRQFEASEIEDLYEVREWIEAAAIAAAVKRASPQELDTLVKTHEQLRLRAQSGDQSDLIEAIIEFHRSICHLSHNARLLRLFDEFSSEMRQILSVLGVKLDESGNPAEGQQALLEHIIARNSAAAAREMRRLIRQAKDEVLHSFHRRHGGKENAGTGTKTP